MQLCVTASIPRAVLWDLDGTLADTMTYHFHAWVATLAVEGYPLTWEAFARSFGQRNDTALNNMLSRELPAAEVTRISQAKETGFRDLVAGQGLQLLPGAESWLHACRAAGWRQALVTSAPAENVHVMVAALRIGEFFDVTVTGDDVTEGKPHPRPFLMAAERLAVTAARCIVVEDSPAGIEAANRAGMRSVGVGVAHAALPATIAIASLADLAPAALEGYLPAA